MFTEQQVAEVLRQGERLLLALEGVRATSALLNTHCEIDDEDLLKVANYMASAAQAIKPGIVGIVMVFKDHDIKGNLFEAKDLHWFDDNQEALAYVQEVIADHGGFAGIMRDSEDGIFLAPIEFGFPESWEQVEKDIKEMKKATDEGVQVMKDLRYYAMES